MANETLMAVPTRFDEFKQVRVFMLRLIERLDIILGYRGEEGYETSVASASKNTTTLASLAEEVRKFYAELDQLDALITTNTTNISTNTTNISTNTTDIATIQQGTSIADTTYTAPTISATYTQSEVQGIADDLETVSDKLDTLLGVLRSSGIVS